MTALRRALYEAAATAASTILLPGLLSRRWREGLGNRLGHGDVFAGPRDGKTIWVHGASVGEVLAARGLVDKLLERYTGHRVFLTTFTTTGRRAAADAFANHGSRVSCALAPLDWWGTPGRALRKKSPGLFINLETELWPGLIESLREAGVPAILVNGRMSERSLPRYRALAWFFRPLLEVFSLICVRTEKDATMFRTVGAPPDRIRVTGNIKYDRPAAPVGPAKVRQWREGLGPIPLLVAGSLRDGEGKMILDAFAVLKKRFPDLGLVMAPRHPDRFDRSVLGEDEGGWTAWSRIGEDGAGDGAAMVLVDTVGDLPDLYGAASLAFVGGTLADGRGHNMLEPAAEGVPVLFGPRYRNFVDEAEALVRGGGGFIVGSAVELARKAEELLADRKKIREAGERAAAVAGSFAGALDRTLAAVDEVLERKRA